MILAQPAPPRVLVLTTFDSDEAVLGALRIGALGFVLKDTPPPDLLGAIRSVADRRPVLSAATSRVIAAATGPHSADSRRTARQSARRQLAHLTARELQTAKAIAEGMSNADIARHLYVSVATVKAHTSSLFAKLAVTNRVQIAILVRDAEG